MPFQVPHHCPLVMALSEITLLRWEPPDVWTVKSPHPWQLTCPLWWETETLKEPAPTNLHQCFPFPLRFLIAAASHPVHPWDICGLSHRFPNVKP